MDDETVSLPTAIAETVDDRRSNAAAVGSHLIMVVILILMDAYVIS